MPPAQRKFTIVPTRPGHMGSAPPPPELLRPMTTKQARKAFLERTRGPRLSRAEQRERERRLQEEIRRDLKEKERRQKEEKDKERQQRKAKILREKKKAREDAEREAKRKAGVPIAPPRPSQPTLAGFFHGNAAGKRKIKEVAESKEPEEAPVCNESLGEGDLPASPSTVTLTPPAKRVKGELPSTERTPSPGSQSPTVAITIEDTPQAPVVENRTPPKSCTPPALPEPSPVPIPAAKSPNMLSPRTSSPKGTSSSQKQPISLQPRSPLRKRSRLPPIFEDAEQSGPISDEDTRSRPEPVFDLTDIEALFPSGTQLQRELFEEHDDSGFNEPEAPVPEPNRDKSPKVSSPIHQDTRDTNSPAPAFQPSVVKAENNDVMPFFCTQDCILSSQDLEEIETRAKPPTKPTPVLPIASPRLNIFPGRSQISSRIPARNRSYYPDNKPKSPVTSAQVVKPLASAVMTNRAPPPRLPTPQRVPLPLTRATPKKAPITPKITTETTAATVAAAPKTRGPPLAAEDLLAMQEASWDDDDDDDYGNDKENTENQAQQFPSMRKGSQQPSQSAKGNHVDLPGGDFGDAFVSSQDMRAMFSVDWDDDLI